MASFKKYIKKKFYNQLYEASSRFVVANKKDLGFYLGWVEVDDIEIKSIYINSTSPKEIEFDVIINCDISMKKWSESYEGELANRWLRVKCYGELNAGVKKFKIKQILQYEKDSNNEFKNPMSDELVPFIWKNDLEKVAEDFLRRHYPLALEVPQAINPYQLTTNMGLEILKKEITPDCSVFGQIYFQDSPDSEIKAGTVLIDSNLENIRNLGVVNNTIVHECVHWDKHRQAFELERAYQQDLSNISTALSVEQKSSKTSATDWMEWHTQTLTPKIMMPRKMFKQEAEAVIKHLVERSDSKDELDIIEKAIDELAHFFEVSRLSAKIRLVELGYDEAIGAFNFIDGVYVPTHSWEKGFLKNNQTFSVGVIDAGLQLLFHPELKKNVESGALIFVESHYCLNEPKYISHDVFGKPFLTPYARHHMDECCIVFEISAKVKAGNQALSLNLVLNRDKQSDIQFNISCPDENNVTVEERADYIATHAQDVMDLLANFPSNLGETLKALMKWREISVEKLAEDSQLDVASISRIRSGKRENPTLKSVIALCVGMKLPPILSHKLIENAGYILRCSNQEQMLYEIILDGCGSLDIYACNELLIRKGFEPLVIEK
ncbi:helix-turn-helix domain-containing protein [Lactococcus lactis]|uniref:helix-turn-helix domain-containing protein n=1 Tax=Lactococcus lactis TaxID=1358 RepID=UPI003D0FAB56